MADPYLEPQEVRDRISVGAARLDPGKFPDEWIARQVAIWERKLERHTGYAYVEREADFADTVRGSLFITPYMLITGIDSVTADGDEVTLSENQPHLAAGMIVCPALRAGQTIRFQGTYGGSQEEAVLETVKEATALYVERTATRSRAGSTPDVSREGFEGGASTVYVQPAPNADPPRLTGWREVDDLVNILERFQMPGIA